MSSAYSYDHLGQRVIKDDTGEGRFVYVYDIFGNLISEYDSLGALLRDYIYLGSHRLAMIQKERQSGGGGGGWGWPGFYVCGSYVEPSSSAAPASASGTQEGETVQPILPGRRGCGVAALDVNTAVNWAVILAVPLAIGLGFKYRRNRIALGCILIVGSGIIAVVMSRETKSQPEYLEKVYYYHNDHLGTAMRMTNEAGEVKWDTNYVPFGGTFGTGAVGVTNYFRFPGQYEDEMTALYYNHHRYYVPDTGRYNRVDPISIAGILPEYNYEIPLFVYIRYDGSNVYIYSENSPIMNVDPLGFDATCSYSITGRSLTCSCPCRDEHPAVTYTCSAASGDNDPAHQDRSNVGPIPTGSWHIGAPSNGWASLTPGGGTDAHGRSGFYIHGCCHTTGCIAITYNSCRDNIMDCLTREGGGTLTVSQ